MTYKTILVVMQGRKDAERVLEYALPLASHFGSHLIGVHAEPIALPYATAIGFPDAGFMDASLALSRERAAEIEALFRSRASLPEVTTEWRSMESLSGDSAASALSIGRAADLVIAAQTDPDDRSDTIANIDQLLFDTGRPALFVPYAGPVKPTFRKVLVAWSGTRESSRAAFDALPFIRAAQETEILTVDAPDMGGNQPEIAGAEIAAALARHGARVTVSSQRSGGIDVTSVIENRAAESGADLLVMGAYGHSRLREFLFGGVTRDVLRSMPLATFMSR
jgi:nucleotide-binding universal stress UspA family protein